MNAEFVFAHAVETFGNKDVAISWFKTKNPALNNRTPLELLFDPGGDLQAVETILIRIEHGVFS